LPHHFVQRRIKAAWGERLGGLDFLAAFPPGGVALIEDALGVGLRFALWRNLI